MFNHYALIDPRSPEDYRYVGRTQHTLKRRLSMHLNTAKTHYPGSPVHQWIVDLLLLGIKPEIVNLSFGFEGDEEFLIKHFAREGHCLLNVVHNYNGKKGE